MNAIDQLLVVQGIDTRIRDAEKELKDIPARKQQEISRLDAFKKRVEEAQKHLKQREAEIKQLELEVKSRQEKITKFRQQQLELKSNKEFRAVETEVEAVNVDISKIEDNQLELMDLLDQSRRALDVESKALKEQESFVMKDVAQLDARLVELQGEVAKLKVEREQAVQGIPPDFLKPYERVLGHKDLALVPLENGICGGCHMKLPPSVVHDTRKRMQLVSCGYCGRLLY